ncbi:DsbA family protein [Subsaximicrobium wynnwilliamsii]|uniref:DsbA family protein n=1 Tax=Subsaximicrobium wynnwilliamsii TaxID=291179 RepID=A0A5C6ZCS1_9FLAO|nr:DsbA family protein [Subsaximicrobium wynnwilliamsii]TXD80720.1 DsbA family protein [Subsaximicrobium wynnwilliamsii]TXD86441.1 DsbA family protein [Subsaximicrobium wynnwilliamsii]TXD99966.1 DsbA family protein [Subsaximicrobium wynnwilliamsii]
MKIVYVYDALCGWCYGFSPVITQFQEKYKDSLSFEVISGGMITGGRIGPIGEVASYISWAYKGVEKATGVKFGSEFLNKTLKNGDAIFTSVPTAIALSVFKNLDPNNNIRFASALQRAIYYDGIEPENLDAYGQIALKFGLDAKSFVLKMKDPLYKKLAEDDFKKSAELNVSGYPTIFIKINGTYQKIGSGYIPFSELKSNYLSIKKRMK